MKSKFFSLLSALFFLCVATLTAQNLHPKREFRGAWIQCVNGQFQGVPTEKIKATLVSQLDNLKGAGINAIIFQVRAECDALYHSSYEHGVVFLPGCKGKRHLPYGIRCNS